MLLRTIFGLLLLTYPFIVYWGLTAGYIKTIALVLATSFLIKLLISKDKSSAIAISIVSLIVCVVTIVTNSQTALLLNPTLINCILGFSFVLSLFSNTPMIERFARLQEPNLPPQAIPYCRKITIIWSVFFIFNASISLWVTLKCSLDIWRFYNGFVAYCLIAALFAGELLYRKLILQPQVLNRSA